MSRVKKLDFKHVSGLIDNVEYEINGCATTCRLTVGDAMIVESSYCYNMETFSGELGEAAAYEKAVDKLFELEAYHQKRLGE